jgi:hypothetical protein
MTVWRPEPIDVRFVAVAPAPADLGTNCDGGALVGAGTDAIGVTLPGSTRSSTIKRVVLQRLFQGQPPVYLPVSFEADAATGVALIAADGVDWAPGYYALTLGTSRTATVPFCVGAMIRQVDYSLVTFVPPNTDGAAARSALVREIDRLTP